MRKRFELPRGGLLPAHRPIALLILVAVLLWQPTPISAQGGITIDKTADRTSVRQGEVITYTITVTNSGPGRQVQVVDTIPFRTQYVSGSVSSTPSGATYDGGKITWSGRLDTDQQVVIRYKVQVTEPETEGPLPIINRAYVGELYDEEEIWAYGPTPTPQPIRVLPVISKRADRTEALPGDEVTFTIEVTNEGGAAAVDVVVVDEVHPYLEILEATTTQGTVTIEGQKVIVEAGVIGPEFVVQIVIRTRVREDAPVPFEIENVAKFRAPNANDLETSLIVAVPAPVLPKTGGAVIGGIIPMSVGAALAAIGVLGRLSGRWRPHAPESK